MFNFNLCLKNNLPKWIDLRTDTGCPDVLDDDTLNITCISSIANCLRYIMKHEKMKEFQISRLYIYYCIDDFNASSILNLIINKGVYSEKDCSYDLCKTDIPKQNENLQKFDIKYMFIKNNIDNIKKYLLNNRPVIIKIPVPSNFENNPSLNLKDFTQKYKEKKIYYIYTTIYGYRTSSKSFICMHSIGKNWGERGFFYVPYKYVKKYAREILVIDNIFYI